MVFARWRLRPKPVALAAESTDHGRGWARHLPGLGLECDVRAEGHPGGSGHQTPRSAGQGRDRSGDKKKLEDLGGVVPDAKGASPEALAALVKSENERWIPLLKAKVKQ